MFLIVKGWNLMMYVKVVNVYVVEKENFCYRECILGECIGWIFVDKRISYHYK